MKLYDKNTLKHSIVLTLVGFFMIPAIVWAIDTVATGFRATATEKKIDIVAASEPGHSANDCYYVRSKTASDYFVPSKTSAEWTAFKSNHSTSQMEKWACGVPENSCRIGYDYLIDGDDAPVRYTPYTNNTTTYQTGTYSLDNTGKDKHCNGDQCGIRASVQCTNNDYAIRVGYQYQIGSTSSSTLYTPRSDVSTAFGAWAKVYDGGQTECDTGCRMRMFIETRGDDSLITCSISYRHRADSGESAWASDGTWSTLTYNTSDDEDCESAGCGMRARIYCDGPGSANSSTSSSGGPVGSCGPAHTQTYTNEPPAGDRCSVGSVFAYNNWGNGWEWQCNAAGGNDACISFSSGGSSTSSTSSSSCFIAGTQVTLENGDTKNIEDVKLGDKLLARGDQVNTVVKRFVIDYAGEVYRFNNSGDYFFTESHPFLTKQGWKSMNPAATRLEMPNFEISQLKVGDTVILDDGEMYISALDSQYQEREVYNFTVDGTHEYIADGYIVHNKLIQ